MNWVNMHLARSSKAILWAAATFVVLELVLQVRSHIRFGQSVFNLAVEKPLYYYSERHGLKLLTPNTVHAGSLARIKTNSIGLRSAEIPKVKSSGEYRVAIVGASSVMGAYSKTNDHTMAAFLEARLREGMPGRSIRVINAGIAGADLDAQTAMLRYIAPLAPDLVVLYTGFNDLAGYCRNPGNAAAENSEWKLPMLKMPSFLLSTDLVLKNTVALRAKHAAAESAVDPKALNVAPFRTDLEELLDASRSLGFKTVIGSVARSYRQDQPVNEQNKLAATALYYHPCFTLQALHQVHDLHNDILRDVARSKGIPVIDLARAIPGGRRYFADSSHFTEAGRRLVANALYEYIRSTAGSGTAPSRP